MPRPDGYTIVIASSSQIINQYLSKTRYDMGKDFTPATYSGPMLRILGVSGDGRVSDLPEVPTMDEAGFPTMNMSPAYYILAPTGTPSIVVDALNRELVKALNAKDVKDKLAATGIDPKSSTREEASALLKKDMARWEKVVKNSGIRLD